jgi:pimeloyl-ACP methyl ester carboxylesterase
MTTSTPTDTVVLVHGLWMTPRSWERWVPYYEAKGYRVITPAYPGFDVEVEALRQNP